MRVTVLGATGRTGRLLVPLLVDAGHDVVATVRREGQVPVVEALGATAVLGDVEGGEHGDLGPAFAGADAVVWTIGATHLDPPGHPERVRDGGLRAVGAAVMARVGRWVQVSSMFADRPDQAPPPLRPAMRLKGDVDVALQRSGLAWTVVRPGGLADLPHTGHVTIAEHLDPGMVTRADVAYVVAELLATGKGAGAAFDLVNGSTPISEAVAAL